MKDIKIRKAETEDAKLLMELRVAQLIAEGCEMLYDTRAEMIDFFERRISDGTYVALLLEADGEIAATAAVLFQEYPPSIDWPGARELISPVSIPKMNTVIMVMPVCC